MKDLNVTFVVENLVNSRGLMGEHGLSLYVDTGEKRYLFDTGQEFCLLPNFKKMGFNLKGLEGVILSHGHYDHTGGLKFLLKELPSLRVMAHPEALGRKFRKKGEKYENIGLEESSGEFIGRANWIFNRGPVEIERDVFLTGEIPPPEGEREGEFYILEEGDYKPDPFREEQALFIKTRKGVMVVSGCAHKGVINTLDYIHHLTGESPAFFLGGTHLFNADEKELDEIVDRIRERDLKYLGICHCTGLESYSYLKEKLPGRVFYQHTGSSFDLSKV